MVSATSIIGALQKQSLDRLRNDRIRLIQDYAEANPNKPSFWHDGVMYGNIHTGSSVIKKDDPFYDRTETFSTHLKSYEDHRARMIAALTRIFKRTAREEAGFIPSYLTLAVKGIMDIEHHFPSEDKVLKWEQAHEPEVKLMRFYSMSHVLM